MTSSGARPLAALAVNIGTLDVAVGRTAAGIADGVSSHGISRAHPTADRGLLSLHRISSALVLGAILKAPRNRRGVFGPLKWLASLVLFVPFLLAAGFV
jgi:hypothetical protein